MVLLIVIWDLVYLFVWGFFGFVLFLFLFFSHVHVSFLCYLEVPVVPRKLFRCRTEKDRRLHVRR